MSIQGTRLETDEEVLRALQRYRPGVNKVPLPAEEPAPPDDAPPLFRPTQRPPTPILMIFDDGLEEGECIRIRQEAFVIGRSEGDLVLPHDGQISSRHSELRRTFVRDKYRWQLNDLGSTNGTYVRIGQAILQDGQEFILGRTRLRFESESSGPSTTPKSDGKIGQTTQHWQGASGIAIVPQIRVLNGDEHRVLLSKKEIWLGKDPSHCQIVLDQDPYVSARHARIRRDDEGRWILENNKAVNGVWLRVEKIPLKGTCRFLLGEQQFRVTIPG